MKNNIKVNPFKQLGYKDKIISVNYDLENILYKIGFYNPKKEVVKDVYVNEISYNPTYKCKSYQRPLVWSIKNKQDLLESIYKGSNIGTVLIQEKDWDWVEQQVKNKNFDNLAFKYVIDGKQRLNAILDFLNNKYPDSNGFYYKDFNDVAKRKMLGFTGLSYSYLTSTSTELDAIEAFIDLNTTGVKMDESHLESVKSLFLS